MSERGRLSSSASPDDVRREAARLGFEVTGWSDAAGEAALDGNGEVFVGTHAEIVAYLAAWSESRSAAARDLSGSLFPWTILPFSTGSKHRLLAGQEATITNRPYADTFLGSRLAISDRMADLFDVVDVKVGNRSILSSSSPIPGFAFAARLADARGPIDLDGDASRGTRWGAVIEVEMAAPAFSGFGRELPFEPCLTAMDLVLIIRARQDAGPDGSDFDAVIIGKMQREPARRAQMWHRPRPGINASPTARGLGLIERWRDIIGSR